MHLSTFNRKKQEELSKPARVLSRFIGGLFVIVVATLLLGELNVPYYGATAWELAGVALKCGLQGVVATAAWTANNFIFVTGAVGTVWLVRIQQCVSNGGEYRADTIEVGLFLVAFALFIIYFAYVNQVLPPKAGVFYRVALFSVIAMLIFGLTVLWHGPYPELVGLMLVIGVGAVGVTAILSTEDLRTGVTYPALNPVLHLLSLIGGSVMGRRFDAEVTKLKRAALKAKQDAS